MVKFLSFQRPLALINGSIILFVSLFSLVTPAVFKLLIEGVLPDGNNRSFLLGAALLICVAVGRSLFGVLQDYVFLLHRQRLEGAALAAALQRDDLKALNMDSTFPVIRNFVANFQYFWIQFAFYVAYAVFISATVLCVFYAIEPAYFWLSLAFMLVHVLNFSAFRPWLHRRVTRFSQAKSGLIGEVSTHIKLLPEMKASAREAFLGERMNRYALGYAEAYRRKEFVNSLQQLVQNGLINAFNVIFFAMALYLSVSRQVSIGSAALGIFLATFLFEPIYRFSTIVKSFFEARSYTAWVPRGRRMREKSRGAGAKLLRLRGVVTRVMSERGLSPLSYEFAPGQLYLIRGPSGCGKSTLLDCIAGLEVPVAGSVDIDSRPRVRSEVFYCEQSPAIFPGSLVQNCSFFQNNPDFGSLDAILRALNLGTLLRNLADDSNLGEISGGQKQRVAVSRSLYCDAPVILYDEPTSALDAENEHALFGRLMLESLTRIVIVVSHSPRALAYAGQVIDLGPEGGA
jgi:ABC-type bacteriocin/lantibiotic exporter with double-glycine peptidase domain